MTPERRKEQICPYCEEPYDGGPLLVDEPQFYHPCKEDILHDLIHWRDTGKWPVGDPSFPDRVIRKHKECLKEIDRLKEQLGGLNNGI